MLFFFTGRKPLLQLDTEMSSWHLTGFWPMLMTLLWMTNNLENICFTCAQLVLCKVNCKNSGADLPMNAAEMVPTSSYPMSL